jgi:hypothetical protein
MKNDNILLTFVYEQFKPEGLPAKMIRISFGHPSSKTFDQFNALEKWMVWYDYYEKFVKMKNNNENTI